MCHCLHVILSDVFDLYLCFHCPPTCYNYFPWFIHYFSGSHMIFIMGGRHVYVSHKTFVMWRLTPIVRTHNPTFLQIILASSYFSLNWLPLQSFRPTTTIPPTLSVCRKSTPPIGFRPTLCIIICNHLPTCRIAFLTLLPMYYNSQILLCPL